MVDVVGAIGGFGGFGSRTAGTAWWRDWLSDGGEVLGDGRSASWGRLGGRLAGEG